MRRALWLAAAFGLGVIAAPALRPKAEDAEEPATGWGSGDPTVWA